MIGREIGNGNPSEVAVTVPLPTWQALVCVVLRRQAPPSIAALASRPAGSLTVRSLGESPPLVANLMSRPTLALAPAAVVLWVRARVGVIDAVATAGSTAVARATTAPARR